jgi:hypothetical protein
MKAAPPRRSVLLASFDLARPSPGSATGHPVQGEALYCFWR